MACHQPNVSLMVQLFAHFKRFLFFFFIATQRENTPLSTGTKGRVPKKSCKKSGLMPKWGGSCNYFYIPKKCPHVSNIFIPETNLEEDQNLGPNAVPFALSNLNSIKPHWNWDNSVKGTGCFTFIFYLLELG